MALCGGFLIGRFSDALSLSSVGPDTLSLAFFFLGGNLLNYGVSRLVMPREWTVRKKWIACGCDAPAERFSSRDWKSESFSVFFGACVSHKGCPGRMPYWCLRNVE